MTWLHEAEEAARKQLAIAKARGENPDAYALLVYPDRFLALSEVVKAGRELHRHIDFGVPPPGWREHHAALARLDDLEDKP